VGALKGWGMGREGCPFPTRKGVGRGTAPPWKMLEFFV